MQIFLSGLRVEHGQWSVECEEQNSKAKGQRTRNNESTSCLGIASSL